MVSPNLLHHYQRGRADRARGTPWEHAPQTATDVELFGESPGQAAYWQGFGAHPGQIPQEMVGGHREQ